MSGQSDYGYPGTGYIGKDGQPHLCRTLHGRPCSKHGNAEHLKDADGNVLTAHSMEELYSKLNVGIAGNPGMTGMPAPGKVFLPPNVDIADIDSSLSEDAASRFRHDVIANGSIKDVIALGKSENGFETPINLIGAWCRRNDKGITDAERTELEHAIVRDVYNKPDAMYSQDYFDAREMILSEADPAYIHELADEKRQKALYDSMNATQDGTDTEVIQPMSKEQVDEVLDAMRTRMDNGAPTAFPKQPGNAVPFPSPAPSPAPFPSTWNAPSAPVQPLPPNVIPFPSPMSARDAYNKRQQGIADYKNKLNELAKKCGIKHYHAYELAFGVDAASYMLRKAMKQARLMIPFPEKPNATNREIRHNKGVPIPFGHRRGMPPTGPAMASRFAGMPTPPPASPAGRYAASNAFNAGGGNGGYAASQQQPLPAQRSPLPLPHAASQPPFPAHSAANQPQPLPTRRHAPLPLPLPSSHSASKPLPAHRWKRRSAAAKTTTSGNQRFLTGSRHSVFSYAGDGKAMYAKRKRSSKAYNDRRFPKFANDTFYEMGIPWNEKSGYFMNQRKLYNDWIATNNHLADYTPKWLRPTLEEHIYATTDWHTYESDAGPVSAGDLFHDTFVRTRSRMKLSLARWLFPKIQHVGNSI